MVLEDLGYLGSIIGNAEGEVWFMATANTPLNSLELNKIINKMAVWEEKEAEWFAKMFRTALANHDAEVAEKRTSKKDAVYLVECLSGGSWHTWKTANTKEEAQAIIDNRLNRLSICRIMVQSKTPVDGKRNTKGTSRKISRKKAV